MDWKAIVIAQGEALGQRHKENISIGEEDRRPPPVATESVGHAWTGCPSPEE